MRKSVIKMIAVILILSMLVGCGNKGSNTGNENEIRIGLNYELSGNVASYGQQSVDGIMMAFDEINANGGINGKQIVPVKIDNKSEAGEATSVATRLMTQENVVACLGPATSGDFMATIPVAMQNSIPVISSSATADYGVTVDNNGKVNDFVFRTCYTDAFQGVTLANFAINNLNATKAVIIQDNSSDYGKGLGENFTKTFKEAGGEIVALEGYVAKDKDFNAILTNIKGEDFDVIFIPGYYEEAGLIIKQARDLDIDAPILGADGFGAPELTTLAGAENLTNVYFSNHYSSLGEDPQVTEFVQAFKGKYNGNEPSAFNALGYDLGYFIADAIERADSTDPLKIKDALKATKDFDGVTGNVTVGDDHNAVKSAFVVELENGVQVSSVQVDPQ
ncbi:MAG: ABC transporter substrate-binding protein [Tissierellia bacterium]|nr:ABC transporter substrate-binding protein [Tissierellia bacterium]MDD4781070.1 ABC transporter substrate-binding protein [Tissierellia bacterium]